jgi:hypothetical protein
MPPQGGEGGRRPGEGGANQPARSAADFLAVEGGRAFCSSFPFYPAALRAGWLEALSRPWRATLPRKRGREVFIGRMRHCKNRPLVITKASPHLVIARAAGPWQSSSFHPARSAADFLAVGSGRAFVYSSPFFSKPYRSLLTAFRSCLARMLPGFSRAEGFSLNGRAGMPLGGGNTGGLRCSGIAGNLSAPRDQRTAARTYTPPRPPVMSMQMNSMSRIP